MTTPVAIVTGASSGIGAATARALAGDGFHVVCAARREDKVLALAEEVAGTPVVCDVTDDESVAELADTVGGKLGGRLDLLVNNAGGAFDADPVSGADLDRWRTTYEVNVLGLVRVTKALLPALLAGDGGLVVNMGSTAGRIAYENGASYTSAKHATQVVTETLRLELVDRPVRFCEIAPGMVATEEFGLVRFDGDQGKRDQVYAGVEQPLLAEDVAECVRWVASLPRHVSVDELVVRPKAQAAQHTVHRGPIG